MTVVDNSLARLHELGWSCGDTAFRERDGRMVWLVYAHKGEEKISVKALSAGEAWANAVAQAERIGT